MAESTFEEMKRYVGFTPDDAEILARFRPLAAPHLKAIADRFYEKLNEHPSAAAVFRDNAQVERLKVTLQEWADRLLAGPHDDSYYELRTRIGRVHVQVGLPHMYMATAMSLVRDSFRQIAFKELEHDPLFRRRVMAALHKILDLDLAIMFESYHEDYVARLFRSEQQAALKRLAAIGEVAATLAHEIRNPLAGISGAMEVFRDDLPEDSPRREVVREVLEQVRRLDERVRDLLLYARRVSLKIQDVDVVKLVESTLAMLQEEPLMRGVKTRIVAGRGLDSHPMDRGQIQEVLVNLIRNAASAMEGKGELSFRIHRRKDGALQIVVEDTGPGVPPERAEEIFKPFVTTSVGGTGLGLSISRRTLEAHGGSLSCEGGSFGGARFVAVLPPAAVLS